jgi:hypothetical protein
MSGSESLTALLIFCGLFYGAYRLIESTEAKYEAERAENRKLVERFIVAVESYAEAQSK